MQNCTLTSAAAGLQDFASDSRCFGLLAVAAMYSVRAVRQGLQRWFVTVLLCFATALLLLDQQLIIVAAAFCFLIASQSFGSCYHIVHDLIWAEHIATRLPLNALSRLWGWCHQLPLPAAARAPTYKLYSRVCSCNLEEAQYKDLSDFRNLSEFFRRDIKPELRPVCPRSCLVSPADGTVLHFGRVHCGHLEQVKGITYTLQGFLGPNITSSSSSSSSSNRGIGRSCTSPDLAAPMESRVPDAAFHDQIKRSHSNELYHCVIYLSPGDYHKFHSAADWQVTKRRHFPGCLLSVSPRVAALVQGLFCMNERVVYSGIWKYGFFSYTAVGATNVGSIRVFCDEKLRTNQRKCGKNYHDHKFASAQPVSKGELFGEFNLGSTIVLLFEAPRNFNFSLQQGQKIKVGQSLCDFE